MRRVGSIARGSATVISMTAVVLTMTAPATGTWGDVATVPGGEVGTTALTAVPVQCEEQTVPLLLNAARVFWTPSASPTTLTYSARIVQSGQSVPVDGNSSATVLPALFGAGLFGQTVTVRVTGSLAGTNWSTSTERTVFVGLLGAYVNCSGP